MKEGGHHHNVNVLRVCRTSDGSIYIISMDESGYIRCWNARCPSTYWDWTRHQDAITDAAICTLSREEMEEMTMNNDSNGNTNDFDGADHELNVLCTVSKDRTLRGYEIPNGRILFHIADSQQALRAVDCRNGYVIVSGKDDYVRCYRLFSNHIEYQFARPKVL